MCPNSDQEVLIGCRDFFEFLFFFWKAFYFHSVRAAESAGEFESQIMFQVDVVKDFERKQSLESA